MEDGHVVFTYTVKTEGLTQEEIYKKCCHCVDLLKAKNDGDKHDLEGKVIVLAQDNDEKIIALRFESPFSFRGTGIGMTRALMSYVLNIVTFDGGCTVTMKNISYYYPVSGGKAERFSAEKSITDEMALNKAKTKLVNYYGDLRKATIDFFDSVSAEFDYVFE